MWNFKGTLWNSTQNILPIHWKKLFLYNIEILNTLTFKSSYAFLNPPPVHCRAREQQAARKASPAPPPKPAAAAAAAADPYGASTDEEDNDDVNDTMEKNGISPGSDEDGDLPPLPDFFKQKGFFLYGSFPAAERRKLFRYITAYNGWG